MLSDPEKRKQYDAGGMFGDGGGGFRFDPSSFRPAWDRSATSSPTCSVAGAVAGAARRRARPGPRDRGPAVLRPGDEGHPGVGQRPGPGALPDLSGSGAKPGTSRDVPAVRRAGRRDRGPGNVLDRPALLACGGRGTIVDDPCPTCAGGVTPQVKRFRVKVPAGVREGSRIRLAGKGEPGTGGGPAGDLYVVTHVAPSPGVQAQGRQPRGGGADHDRRGGQGRDRRGADAGWRQANPGSGRHRRRQRAAAARRGAGEALRPWPRRHPLPVPDPDPEVADNEQRRPWTGSPRS